MEATLFEDTERAEESVASSVSLFSVEKSFAEGWFIGRICEGKISCMV
jgi:hypothetical protein